MLYFRLFVLLYLLFSCTPPTRQETKKKTQKTKLYSHIISPGAYQTKQYFPLLKGKQLALTVNPSSMLSTTHLVDTLIRSGMKVAKVFTPEHGFSGKSSDGETVIYQKQEENYELISLYGKNKKPTKSQLAGIDIMLFDIQDVGVRFYTYISTMHYIMEACAEAKIPVILIR